MRYLAGTALRLAKSFEPGVEVDLRAERWTFASAS